MIKERTLTLFRDKNYFQKLFFISIPIILQNLITSSVNLLDTIMVGKLGDMPVAAVGIGNQIFLLVYLMTLGISSGSGVFIAQYWGKKDEKSIRKVLGFSMISSGLFALLFSVIVYFFSENIVALFNNSPEIVSQGGAYLKIISLSYFLNALTIALSNGARSVENSMPPMVASFIALVINGVLNYVFIFGKFGLEPMGVKGAAYGTLIARTVEFFVLFLYLLKNNKVLLGKLSDLVSFSLDFIKNVTKVVISVVLNEMTWGLGIVLYSIIYGKIGPEALASVQIYNTVVNFFFILVLGIGAGTVVIVGKEIGTGDIEKARTYGHNSFILSIYIGLILSVILVIATPYIVKFFNVSESVRESTKIILYITAALFTMRCINIVLIIGVLRGGGDARFAFVLEAITVWLIGVPIAFISVIVFKVPIHVAVGLVMVEEVIKAILAIRRLYSDEWIRVLT